MDRTRRNGVQYGRRWSIMVDYCRQLQWFTMDGVGRQSRKVLFVGQLKISDQSREKGFFLLAQPQSVLHFWDVCDWFRFIISLHFSERCKVTPPWGYGVCSVNEICANTQDLCERSDLLARFERLQASQSHRLTPHICIGQCLFGAWKFWKANGREICDFVWKAATQYLQILILMLRLFCANLREVPRSGQICN